MILNKNKTTLMGILNVTPDSFSDGGQHNTLDKAVEHANMMVVAGAGIIDVGGESTRPGADRLSVVDEAARIVPVIKKITKQLDIPVSVDSYKTEIVRQSLDAGASMVNDVNGLRSPGMAELIADYDVSVCIMHMQGNPKDMQDNPDYIDVVDDIKYFLERQVEYAISKGIDESKIILDPGIGFGKTLENNLEIIQRIDEFKELGYPLLIGHSRKSFIGQILDEPVEKRLSGTLAITSYLVLKGIDLIRVHDVAENKRVVDVIDAIRGV